MLKRTKEMVEIVYVVYCYYPPFAKLPKRRWVRFKSRKAAIDFKEKKVDGVKGRFFWAFVIDGMEVENI